MLTLTSPVDTWLHEIRAGTKLGLLFVASIILFQIGSLPVLCGIVIAIGFVYAGCGGVFLRQGLLMLRPLLPFVVIVVLWHLWTTNIGGGTLIILRMIMAVSLANLVTMTTRLSDMIEVIERLTQSLSWIGINPRAIALAMALTIRFIPVMGQKMEMINLAWKARSVQRSRWRIFIPVILAVIDDATHVADSLRARGGADRTLSEGGD